MSPASKNTAPLLKKFTTFLEHTYRIQGVSKYSADGTQTIYFRKGGKALCYIDIKGETSTVTVVIGNSLSEQVAKLPLLPETERKLRSARAYHDGRWLQFGLNDPRELDDLKQLIVLKKKPPR